MSSSSDVADATIFEADQPVPEVPAWLIKEQAARPRGVSRLRVVDQGERAPADQRAVIQMQPGELHHYADIVERAVADVIYTQGGTRMVRLGCAAELQEKEKDDAKEKKRKAIRRDPAQQVILPASPEWLRRRMSERVLCQKWDARAQDWRIIDVPRDLALDISGQGDWPAWRELAGVASAPFLREDLTVCDRPGYDERSRVYLMLRGDFPMIPERPSKVDARAALDRLLEPFSEFPFASPAARSAFVAHILTAAARHALDVRPVFIYSAPLRGTGKTLLARQAGLIAEGVLPPARPWPEDEPELRKVLLAVLMTGDSTILFDNVPTGSKIRSAGVCRFATTALYADRVLGATRDAMVENRTVIVMTGNNITPTGDLSRRAIIVRQDAGVEKVLGRQFRIPDLKEYVLEHRAELLACALTILRARALADDQMSAPPLPTFERWSRICREPLIWLGMTDPLETQSAEADEDTDGLAEALEAVRTRLGGGEWTAAELEAAADERMMMSERTARAGMLAAALAAGGLTDPRRARYWLREMRDRVAGGLKLVQVGKHARAGRWQVRG